MSKALELIEDLKPFRKSADTPGIVRGVQKEFLDRLGDIPFHEQPKKIRSGLTGNIIYFHNKNKYLTVIIRAWSPNRTYSSSHPTPLGASMSYSIGEKDPLISPRPVSRFSEIFSAGSEDLSRISNGIDKAVKIVKDFMNK